MPEKPYSLRNRLVRWPGRRPTGRPSISVYAFMTERARPAEPFRTVEGARPGASPADGDRGEVPPGLLASSNNPRKRSECRDDTRRLEPADIGAAYRADQVRGSSSYASLSFTPSQRRSRATSSTGAKPCGCPPAHGRPIWEPSRPIIRGPKLAPSTKGTVYRGLLDACQACKAFLVDHGGTRIVPSSIIRRWNNVNRFACINRVDRCRPVGPGQAGRILRLRTPLFRRA